VQRVREAQLSPWIGHRQEGGGGGVGCQSAKGGAEAGRWSNRAMQGPGTGMTASTMEGGGARWA
jgi:hypothetical protein